MNRQKFIKNTATCSIAVGAMPTVLTGISLKGANDREANAMLTKKYRKPCAVPDKV